VRLEPREDGQRRLATPLVPGHHRRERHARTEAPVGSALHRELVLLAGRARVLGAASPAGASELGQCTRGARLDEPANARACDLLTRRTKALDEATRAAVVRLCVEAHQEPDFENLFSYLPPEGLHVLARLGEQLVGHAVVTTRWLQPNGLPLLRTAYVDAVATSPEYQGRGIGSAVMRHLAAFITDYDVACLETERQPFYERLGWEEWRGPLAGRSDDGLIPTPDETGVMILRLPRTPDLDLEALMTIEATAARIW
jgi:aminoglycoside 2'-N-acetyltransferase I